MRNTFNASKTRRFAEFPKPRLAVLAVAAVLVLASPIVLALRPANGEAAAPAAPAAAVDASGNLVLSLPRIPWEGGADYWKQFSKPNAAGWANPAFFPIVAWFDGISTNAEAQYDKGLGINTYIGMSETTPYSLFADNNLYWIGGALNSTFTDKSTNWVGDFLGDEADGRYSPAEGQAHLQSVVDGLKGDGRFKYANFTQMVMSKDMNQADAQKYVNAYTDAVSIDMYWYTIPFCDAVPYRENYITPVLQRNCRTSSSYGKTVKSLRQQDAADGKLQPVWQFVENLNGGPADGPFSGNISGGQLKGAVMSSLINEARGIVYFNTSFSGTCQTGGVFRAAQMVPGFCGSEQVAAAKEVNNEIKQLAPILNTQSYQYTFGTGLDTMLKTEGRSAYIFTMADGSSQPGQRDLQLPAGMNPTSVEVLFENRTVPVDANGHFSDQFPNEYSYHIYKVTM